MNSHQIKEVPGGLGSSDRDEFVRANDNGDGRNSEVRRSATPPTADIALEYLKVRGMQCVAWRGEIYRYTGTHYTPIPDCDLKADIVRFLQDGEHRRRAGTRLTHDVLANIHGLNFLFSDVEPPLLLSNSTPMPCPRDLIPLKNGILYVRALLQGENPLITHGSEWFLTDSLPYEYHPDAGEPKMWHQFLDDLFDDDVESRDTLQEMFGYLLTLDTRQQKIFLIVGPKRSGKGTIGRIITALLGRDNVAAPTLSSLSRDFGLAPLIGKRAALIADARIGSKTDQASIAEELLSISGEDSRTINRKYRPQWTGRLPVRFVLLSNELPRITDASGALASRFVVITLRESFYGEEDPTLTDKLLRELPQIALWAIEGLRRLYARGHFLQPSRSFESMRDLEDLGSPISAFLRDRCELGPGYETEIPKLFEEWKSWGRDMGREHAGTLQVFGRDLRAAIPTIRIIRPNEEGNRIRKYTGIRLLRDR